MRRLVLRSESIHLSGIDALHRVWAIPIVVLLALSLIHIFFGKFIYIRKRPLKSTKKPETKGSGP